MENHYRINVAKANGRNWDNSGPRYLHFFATEVRDLINAKQVHAELLAAFPAPEYSISVTRWEASGTGVEF